MSHAYHETLPGYDAEQIWFDGCDECEYRGRNLPLGIASLDPASFRNAVARAELWVWRPERIRVSNAERDLLSVLVAIKAQQTRAVLFPAVPGD